MANHGVLVRTGVQLQPTPRYSSVSTKHTPPTSQECRQRSGLFYTRDQTRAKLTVRLGGSNLTQLRNTAAINVHVLITKYNTCLYIFIRIRHLINLGTPQLFWRVPTLVCREYTPHVNSLPNGKRFIALPTGPYISHIDLQRQSSSSCSHLPISSFFSRNYDGSPPK